jgi:transcriptional regulator with XRE-family HTH domain
MPATTTPTVPTFEARHRLALARESAGLTQGELADRLEVSRSTVSNYESGATKRYTRPIIRLWAQVCGVPAEWLLTGDVRPARRPRRGGPNSRPGSAAYRDTYPAVGLRLVA